MDAKRRLKMAKSRVRQRPVAPMRHRGLDNQNS